MDSLFGNLVLETLMLTAMSHSRQLLLLTVVSEIIIQGQTKVHQTNIASLRVPSKEHENKARIYGEGGFFSPV